MICSTLLITKLTALVGQTGVAGDGRMTGRDTHQAEDGSSYGTRKLRLAMLGSVARGLAGGRGRRGIERMGSCLRFLSGALPTGAEASFKLG